MKFIWNFGSLQLSGKGFDLAEPLPEVEGKMARASPSIRRNLSALCDEKLLFFPPLDVLEMQSGKPRKVVRKFNVSIHLNDKTRRKMFNAIRRKAETEI